MLALSRPQRQIAATLVLLSCFVTPTVYIAVAAWRVNRPEHSDLIASALGARLGLHVELHSVKYPRPGVVTCREVVLAPDQGTAERSASSEIARAVAIRLRKGGGQLAIETDGLRLRAPLATRPNLDFLMSALARVASEPTCGMISLLAPTCEIEVGRDVPALSLRDLAWTYEPSSSGSRLSASYRVSDPRGAFVRCEMTLERGIAADAGFTTLTLRSADGQSLPARLLNPFFSSEEWFGDQATVEGELVLHANGAEPWEARFRGTFHDVDLASVAGRIAPDHRLSGRATISIETAEWRERPGRGPGWVTVDGRVVSKTAGTVGSGLLAALENELGFQLAEPSPSTTGERAFQALGLTFAIDSRGGVRLGGALNGPYPPDAVLIDNRSPAPLAFAPRSPATVFALIRTLAPTDANQNDQWIPARQDSLLIQRHLPSPFVDGSLRRATHGERIGDPAFPESE